MGKIIMEAAAKNLIPVTLELGGKSPVIVDRTANLGIAAKRIIWGKLLNTGQSSLKLPHGICSHVGRNIRSHFAHYGVSSPR